MRWGIAVCVLTAGLGCSAVAEAQIVNVLYDAPADAEEGFGGRATAGGQWVSGNVTRVELDASLSTRYVLGRHLWLLYGNGGYGRINGQDVKNRATGHIRYRVDVAGPVQWEAYGQVDRNDFRRRLTRAVLGTGPRVELLAGSPMWLALGASYMPEFERLNEGSFVDSGQARWHHRASFYLIATVQPTKRFRLLYTSYVQPALNAIDNLRSFSDLSLQLTVWQSLSVIASHTLQLDTEPPDTVRPVDAERKLTIAYQW